MHLRALPPVLLFAAAALASPPNPDGETDIWDEAQSLVSAYVPASVYGQLTASVASAAAAASVTGDPASLLLSALLDTSQPAWFTSAVPSYFTGNIAALESAVATLRDAQPTSASFTGTTVVATTTNSQGNTITTSFTSSVSKTASTSTNAAAAPTAVDLHHAGLGAAALAVGLVALL